MTAPIPNHHHKSLITRRSILIGVAASLICAPAIVRATNLMPVRSLPLPSLNPLGEFYRRCFYHNLDFELRTGRSMTMVVESGKIISVADARRKVAYARAQGWLPPSRHNQRGASRLLDYARGRLHHQGRTSTQHNRYFSPEPCRRRRSTRHYARQAGPLCE